MECLQYIGIDLHRQYFQACVLAADGTRCWEGRFGATAADLASFVARGVTGSRVAVEASGPTWQFVDALAPHVAEVVVVDSAKTRLKAGYAAKTDRLDARRLADALRRQSVVAIYVPPPAVRELRELTRAHRTLVRVSTGLKQRLHALVLRQRLCAPPVSDLFGGEGRAWLRTVALPPRASQARTLLLTLWEQVATHERALRAEIEQLAAADPDVRAIDALPGIGAVLGTVIRAEVGDVTRFRTGGALASYAGLVPRVVSSGGRTRYGRITRTGSPYLRWALIEAAIHAPRRSDGVGRWTRKLAVRKNALLARTAAARRLCDDVVTAWRARRASSPPVSARTESGAGASVPVGL
jgi:transposase